MKKILRLLKIFLIIILIIDTVGASKTVKAANEKRISIEHADDGDFTVMFTFDSQVVDITFISPDDERYTKDSSDVDYANGENWATYRINDAQPGKWYAEYDPLDNKDVDYTVIKAHRAQSTSDFDVSVKSDKIVVTFTTSHPVDDEYTYAISIENTETNDVSKLAEGTATTNEKVTVDISTAAIPEGKYNVILDTSYNDGTITMPTKNMSEEITIHNSSELSELSDYKIFVDMVENKFVFDWSEYAQKSAEQYKLHAWVDGEDYYQEYLDGTEQKSSLLIPVDTKKVTCSITVLEDGIWSRENRKEIDLEKNYLRLATEDNTIGGYAVLEYSTENETELFINMNENEASADINGADVLSFELQPDINQFKAWFTDDNNVTYSLEKEIFYDVYPPNIMLFDNVDGKTVNDSTFTLLGKVYNGEKIYVNDVEKTLEPSGEFAIEVELNAGENVFNIFTQGTNGLSAQVTVSIFREEEGLIINGKAGWLEFLPLYISLLVSVLVIIFALVFFKKNASTKLKTVQFIISILMLAIIEIATFVYRMNIGKKMDSIEYLEIAENSFRDAIDYAKMYTNLEYVLKVVGIVMIIILIAYIADCIRTFFKRRFSKKQTVTAQNDDNITNPKMEYRRYCRYCGEEIAGEALFCTKCGQKLSD